MASLVIDPIPAPLLERLREAAAAHRRSPAEEATSLLERSLPASSQGAAGRLERIRAARRSLEGKMPLLSEKILNEARGEGRP